MFITTCSFIPYSRVVCFSYPKGTQLFVSYRGVSYKLILSVSNICSFSGTQYSLFQVGHSDAYIDGGRPKCRIEECSFGNFVTDAMASEMGVDIAFINSGAIKGSFDPHRRNGKKDKYTFNFSKAPFKYCLIKGLGGWGKPNDYVRI